MLGTAFASCEDGERWRPQSTNCGAEKRPSEPRRVSAERKRGPWFIAVSPKEVREPAFVSELDNEILVEPLEEAARLVDKSKSLDELRKSLEELTARKEKIK
jgi:hypothetical protein